MSFGENLKRICKEKGTTPSAILQKWGLSTSKVSAWYNGSLPKQDLLNRFAEELDCSVADFFIDEKDLPEREIDTVEKEEAEPENDDEKDILRIYRSLSRRAKHEFMTMAYEFELAGDKTHAVG